MKKLLLIIISITLLMLSVPIVSNANVISTNDVATSFSDISGHWAEGTIKVWHDSGLLEGYDDETFKPNIEISKVEFITLVNRIYGYYEITDANYIDVSETIWYSTDCKIAKVNGYMDWYEEELLNPTESITRAETSAIIATILQLEATENNTAIEEYADENKVPEWSTSYVDAVVNARIMQGYNIDNTLRAENNITRAEAVTMLDRAMGELIHQAGTYGPEEGTQIISSNLTINTNNVKLQNTIIEGDLILAAGIADGDINLSNVTVKGRTLINGGGENSIKITGSNLGEIRVYKLDGQIRVVLADSESEKVILQSGGKLEIDNTNKEVIIATKVEEEVILEGNFENILIDSQAIVQIIGDTKVSKFETTDKAEGTIVEIDTLAFIDNFIFNAGTTVTGKGNIELAIVNANNSSTEQYCDAKTTKNEINSEEVKVKIHYTYVPPAPPVLSAEKALLLTSVGLISGGNIIDVPDSGITVAALKTVLSVSALATFDILASAGGSVAADGDTVDNNMKVLVTAEDGSTTEYDITTTDGTTTTNPYHIYTAEDLNAVRGGVADYPGWDLTKKYIVENDIDLELFILANYDDDFATAGIQGVWVPIGRDFNDFSGTIDGNNKTISNLTINRDNNNQGLFGYTDTDATISNVKLTNVNINQDITPTVAKNIAGLVGYNFGDISNSSVTGNIKGKNYVGGLVGRTGNGNIINCSTSTYVEGLDNYVGGLIASSSAPVVVTGSYATGNVIGNQFVGGLIGSSFGQVINSYATGNVTGTKRTGGLLGYSDTEQISGSYAAGNVIGTDMTGGLVGDCRGSIINSYTTGNVTGNEYIGGLVGYNDSFLLTDNYTFTYATGSISGNSCVGGIVGLNRKIEIESSYALNNTIIRKSGTNESLKRITYYNLGGTLTNNYANSEMVFSGITYTPTSKVGGVDGADISLDDAKLKATYEANSWDIGTGTDYTHTWWIDEGNSYPTLSWQH